LVLNENKSVQDEENLKNLKNKLNKING
jgi:hypothetical protein